MSESDKENVRTLLDKPVDKLTVTELERVLQFKRQEEERLEKERIAREEQERQAQAAKARRALYSQLEDSFAQTPATEEEIIALRKILMKEYSNSISEEELKNWESWLAYQRKYRKEA